MGDFLFPDEEEANGELTPTGESRFTLDFDDEEEDDGLFDLMDDFEEDEVAAPIVKRRASVRGPSASRFLAENGVSPNGSGGCEERESDKVFPKNAEEYLFLLNAIRNLHFIIALDTEEKHSIVKALAPRKVSPEQLLIREKEDGDVFYVIQNGLYEVRKLINGEDTVVKIYDNFGAFGELSLLYSKKRDASVIAKTEGKVWTLDQATFTELVVMGAQRRQRRRMQLIDNVNIFRQSGLNEETKEQLVNVLKMRCYTKDEIILLQGQEGTEIFFIEKGEVRMVYVDPKIMAPPENYPQLKNKGPGSMFGEVAVLKKSRRNLTIIADSDEVLLAVLSDEDCFRILRGPELEALFKAMESYVKL